MRRSRLAPWFALSTALAPLHGCSSSDAPGGAPSRTCDVTVWHRASSARAVVEVVGSWDGWKRPGRILPADRADGYRVTAFAARPGAYSYGVVEDGAWVVDPFVPTTAFHDGHEVAWVEVPDCGAPGVRVDRAAGSADGAATIEGTFFTRVNGALLDPSAVRIVERDGSPVAGAAQGDPRRGTFTFAARGLAPGKHTLTVRAKDQEGRDADAALATAWIEPRPFELEDSVIYQVMVDRFRGADGPLAPPASPAARAGGSVRGVLRELDAIVKLGFNTIWLSPLYKNPSGTYAGNDGRQYSSYHGYWPIAPRALEPAVATEADVDALVAAAHARGVRILFDVVPNHVHSEHPYAREHMVDGWFDGKGGACVCGVGSCDWANHIQDCWFEPYLPDIDWKNDAAAARMTADVGWWMDRFDADGVRVDAVPMMPRAASRRISAQIRARHDHDGHRSLVLGENFTGPDGYSLLRYQLGPYGLDSEFHFPLMWALRSAVASGSSPMTDIDGAIRAGEKAWQGSGAVMALMIGNHDVARFASVSSGDDGGDGWSPAPTPADPTVYARQRLALGAIYALPGMPVVYYGDEVALPGRYDPDSRRVMPAEEALSPEQIAVRSLVFDLGRARACVGALRRGSYRLLYGDDERLVFARESAGDRAVVVLSRQSSAPLAVAVPAFPAGDYVDVLSGAKASLSPALTNFTVAPFSVQIFVPSGSPCALRGP